MDRRRPQHGEIRPPEAAIKNRQRQSVGCLASESSIVTLKGIPPLAAIIISERA